MISTIDILVVEDHERDLRVLEELLSSASYRIVTARTGAEALRLLLDADVALVLIDIVLPDMSGFEVAELVHRRERTAAVPIVFMTAHSADPELLRRSYRAGAIDYLTKPLIPEIVRAKVAVFAQLYRQRQQLVAQADKNREVALLELRLAAERHYRSLAEAVPNIVWTAQPNGDVDYFNRRWFEYTGMSIANAAGSWSSVVYPDDLAASDAAWQRALDTGEVQQFECRLRRADGVYRWHLCRAVPELGTSGQVVAWLGSFTDIDDERRARAILAELKGTIDAVLDAVIIFDADDWRVRYVNEGASAMLGYSQDELTKLLPTDVTAEHDAAALRELLMPLVVGEKTTQTIETRFRRRDRRIVPVEVSFQVIPIDGGRIVSIARDITERMRARLERELLYRETVEALRARDEFLSVASHELRTPLSALQLQIELLLHPPGRQAAAPNTPEQLKAKLERAGRQVDRLGRLISELLDVSRITGGRLRLERKEADLAAIAADVVERFADDAARVHCAVTISAPVPVHGRWDHLRLEQVVMNLLTNAFKFGADKPIEVGVTGDATTARLTVTDHGIGIAAEDLDRVFHRFEQAAARSYGGLGLGLYIVRGIVEAHGGSVAVESAPGAGSTFIIELPRYPAEDTHAAEHDERSGTAGDHEAHLDRG